MFKVRNNVFETNSSSSHSLVYSQKNPNRIEYKLQTDNGILTIHFRDYGWCGPDSFDGFGTDDILASSNYKLDYVMTRLCRHLNWGEEHDPTHEEAKIMISNGAIYEVDEAAELLEKIQKLCPEIKEIRFELNEYGDPFGSIDHESRDLLDGENLINIIFNKGCLIVIDNDNSSHYEFFNEYLKPGEGSLYGWGGKRSVYNITEKDFED